MKNIKLHLLIFLFCILGVSSCSLDNFDAPNASLSGKIIDAETGELIQSDIIEGTTIKIVEHGYDPVSPQYLRVKTDGTYANTLLFSNVYTVQPGVRNFIQVDEQEVTIGKDTKLDFYVIPYIRVKDVSFTTDGNDIVARFKLQQTTADVVKKIGLFVNDQPIVGEPVRTVGAENLLNRLVDEAEEFVLKINVARNSNYLKTGKSYYFRIGALSSFPGARYNYAAMEKIEIGEIVPEEDEKAQVLDDCESIDGWTGSNPLSLDPNASKGSYSVKASVAAGGAVIFQKAYTTPFNTGVSKEDGYFAFSLYISDISQINFENKGSCIELTSGGIPDDHELAWDFDNSLRLRDGWNEVKLKLSDGIVTGGNIDLSAVNFIRIFHLEIIGSLEMKIDNIRFCGE